MAKDLKKAATEALDFNKHLDKVFVTTDGTTFIHKGDAVNHAATQDDKTVEVFERGEEAAVTTDEKPMAAKDLILLIEKGESQEAVENLLGLDTRATVKAAANKRIAELKQLALDAQAAAADEAFKQRNTATGE